MSSSQPESPSGVDETMEPVASPISPPVLVEHSPTVNHAPAEQPEEFEPPPTSQPPPPPPPRVSTTSAPTTSSAPATLQCDECAASIPVNEFSQHVRGHFTSQLAAAQLELTHLKEEKQRQVTNIESERDELVASLRSAEQRLDALEITRAQEEHEHQQQQRNQQQNGHDEQGSGEVIKPAYESEPASTGVLSTSDLSALSLTFFPELEPLLGSVPPKSQAHIFTAASVYLYDSFHCRSIKHATDFDAFLAYKFIHVSKWKSFVRWVSWIHLLLGFIEPPSSIRIEMVRYGPSHAVCGVLEFLCMSIYTFHLVKQYKAYGPGAKGYFRSPWRTAKIPILIICFVDILISMGRNVDTPGVHLSQILRVFFVLEQSGRMRQLCSCILKSLPAIISIMFLCFVHVFVFGVLGFLFIGPVESVSDIDPDGKLYFSSLSRSFLSMFILLTSENFPEVMLPSYRQHWFVCIFFVMFVIIGLYGLLQLTTAVVFHSFQLHTKDKLQRALHYRERALQAAFTLLSEYTCGDGGIALDTWTKLLQQVRPDWTELQAEILFRAATGAQDSELDRELAEVKGVELPDDATNKKRTGTLTQNPARASLPKLSEEDEADEEIGTAGTSGRSVSFAPDVVKEEPAPAAPKPRPVQTMDFLQFEQIVRFTQKSFQFETTMAGGADVAHPPAPAHLSARVSAGSSANVTSGTGPSSAPAEHSIAMATLATNIPVSDDSIQYVQEQHMPMHRYQYGQGLWLALVKYYTIRITIPTLFLQLIGRTEQHIVERENDGSTDEDGLNLDTVAGQTPIHPILSIRTLLTSFNLSDFISDFFVIIHSMFLVLSIYLDELNTTTDYSGTVSAFNVVIVLLEVQFLLELISKLIICRSRFFASRLQILDLVTIIIVWIAQILVWSHIGSAADAVSCIRLFRGFRLYHRLNSFTLLLQVLSQVGPPLAALLGVLFILLYTYSQIGMMFFCNELVYGNLNDDLDYDQGDFYALNFNDLAHSLMALFYQLVVNDWWILMEAVVYRVGVAARIYFISFYCISVLIVFSVCTAFVVEAYMDMHETKVAASQKGKSTAPKAQVESLPMPQPVSLAPGLAKEANEGGGFEGSRMRKASRDLNDALSKDEDTVASPRSSTGNGAEGGLRRRPSLQPSKSFRQFQMARISSSRQLSIGGRDDRPPPPPSVSISTSSSSSSASSPTTPTNASRAPPAPFQRAATHGNLNKLASSRSLHRSDTGLQSSDAGFVLKTVSTVASTLAAGSGSLIPDQKMEVTTEALLLSRIRTRASSMGLKVKLKPTGGMVNTLRNIFGSELEEQEDDATVEETDETEDDN